MAVDPWTYAEKTGLEHAHQAALFMWANMANRIGLEGADDRDSYIKPGHAIARYGVAGKLASPRGIWQLKWLHAIHNQGHGDAIRGGKARAEGVKAGVSDLFLPVPVRLPSELNGAIGGALQTGFYLELKVGKNTPSEIQLEFMADMRAAGYAADWAIGWLDARQKILAYLQINC